MASSLDKPVVNADGIIICNMQCGVSCHCLECVPAYCTDIPIRCGSSSTGYSVFFAESRIVPLPYASASVSVPIDRPLLELQTSPVRVWQTDAFVTFNGPKNELPAALFSCSKRSAFVVYVMETSMQRWCGVLVARLRWRG